MDYVGLCYMYSAASLQILERWSR